MKKEEEKGKDDIKPTDGPEASDVKPMSLQELDNMRIELYPQLQ